MLDFLSSQKSPPLTLKTQYASFIPEGMNIMIKNNSISLSIFNHREERNTMIIDKLIFTATEAAAILGVSTQTVYALLEVGKLRGYKENEYSSWKITRDALQEYVCIREAEALERMEKIRKNAVNKEDIFKEKDGKSPKKPPTSK